MVQLFDSVDTYTVILFLMLAAMVTLLIFSMLPRRAEHQGKPPIKTLIRCVDGHEVERDFSKGDYVGKKVECPQCGKEAIIIAIYSKQAVQQARKP